MSSDLAREMGEEGRAERNWTRGIGRFSDLNPKFFSGLKVKFQLFRSVTSKTVLQNSDFGTKISKKNFFETLTKF